MPCRTSYCYFHNCRYNFHVIIFCWYSLSYLHSSSDYLQSIFCPETTFSASNHRGIFYVAKDYFCHFQLVSFPLFFLVHNYPSPTIYHICIYGRDQTGCFFQFLSFFKIILFWRWSCFFSPCKCCLRRLVRWIR